MSKTKRDDDEHERKRFWPGPLMKWITIPSPSYIPAILHQKKKISETM